MLSYLVVATLTAINAPTQSQPYGLGAPASVEGAKQTVARLLEATDAHDDATYDIIARGMVIMLAPDFGVPVNRAKFADILKDCSDRRVISAEPFPKMPQVQSVRIEMKCREKEKTEPKTVIADFMADDEHAFVVFPGGVAAVWREPKPK